MVIFHGDAKPILNAIIAISMVIFLGSVNPMLKKNSMEQVIVTRKMIRTYGILTMEQVITWAVTRRNLWSLKKRPREMFQEVWSGVKPRVDHLKVFGSIAYAHVFN